jgi:hypothetical protein
MEKEDEIKIREKHQNSEIVDMSCFRGLAKMA